METKQPIIEDQQRLPCGCVITKFSDGRVDHQLCLVHAFANLAGICQQISHRFAEMQRPVPTQEFIDGNKR